MQVLGAASAAARSLELTGDADVWSVTSGEIRNYHLHWGGPLSAAVLPTSTGGYRVWLSTSAFFLLAAVLFVPVGLYAAPAVVRLPTILRQSPGTVMRGWKRHEVTFERGAALLGLVADRHRPADFRSRVEQSRVLPSQKYAARDDRGDPARHLFRSTSRPPRRRAHDSHPECARGVGLHRSDRGNSHRGCRDAVVAPRRSGPFSVGCRDQRGRRDRTWDCLHANTGRSPVPDGARTGRARRARTLSAVSECAAAFSAVGICCSGADRAAHSAHRARDLRRIADEQSAHRRRSARRRAVPEICRSRSWRVLVSQCKHGRVQHI